jgi:DNA-binding MarR family transcriptional regulator
LYSVLCIKHSALRECPIIAEKHILCGANDLTLGARLHREPQCAAAAPGLSQARYQVLSVLDFEGEQTQRDLALRLGVEQATMANTLTRMTRDGLIARKPHPDDGRAQLVALTQAARDLVAPADQAIKGC